MTNSHAGSPALMDADNSANLKQALSHLEAGRKAEAEQDRWTAIERFEDAFENAPGHEEICFRLAYHLDLVGEGAEALHLYEQACADPPAKMNALVNLAVIYEDAEKFAEAERCLRQVLETDPNHERARLFMKDVLASRRMFYDEDQQRTREKQNTLLETPVTDFELSVRVRTCLKKMNIRTLGDLLRTTEAELLAYKNFGETSLQEIKAMLAQKGLRLGQAVEDRQSESQQEVYDQLAEAGHQEVLSQPVAELDLSARARKALSLLGIQTVSDLISRTEAELLGIKNFGLTSLSEIKEKLDEHGLSLRQLEE